MLYDYQCNKCNKIQEEYHGMLEKPVIICKVKKCRGICSKLIGRGQHIMGMAGGRGVYDFVDFNTTGKPVVINSKRQWQNHLKQHGLNDDMNNSPMKKSDIEGIEKKEKEKKLKQRKEIKKAVIESFKNKKHRSDVYKKYSKLSK